MKVVGQTHEQIAVIGLSGRFPGARSIAEFRNNQRCNAKAGSNIAQPEWFDARFFDINPEEAALIDPQHRVLLECAWEALEYAGIQPDLYPGSIGVFAGSGPNTYLIANLPEDPAMVHRIGGLQSLIASEKDFLPMRISFHLNLRGPSLNIQTGCSTSLVAVAEACHHLLSGQCDIALAGGSSISFPHNKTISYQENNTAPEDAAGIVVLKRLPDALADGDTICAVIRGYAVNNDGARKSGFTQPGNCGRKEVIGLARSHAGVSAESISFTHTHNGNLDAAAGITALINAVLTLQYHKQATANGSLRAGVSSFSIGGTHAHIILEEAPQIEPSDPAKSWQMLVLSAKTSTALDKATAALRQHLQQNSTLNIADIAWTLQTGRKAFSHRRVLLVKDASDALQILSAGDNPRIISGNAAVPEPPVAFIFPDQCLQLVNMSRSLYTNEPVFHDNIIRCSDILLPHLGFDLRTVLYPAKDTEMAAAARLTQTAVAQPALFVLSYALAQWWLSHGIPLQSMIGHGTGEYVAACLADVFSLEDALALVTAQAWLIHALPAGAMISVQLPESEMAPMLGEELSIAAVNAPRECVISGPVKPLMALLKTLNGLRISCRRLPSAHALHSTMVEPAMDAFASEVRKVKPRPPKIPFISGITAQWITPQEATDPAYWAAQMRQTVRFSDCADLLLNEKHPVILEAGFGDSLSQFVRQQPVAGKSPAIISSLSHDSTVCEELVSSLLHATGQLWISGVSIDWASFHAFTRRLRIPLPSYPFERERFSLCKPEAPDETTSQHSEAHHQ